MIYLTIQTTHFGGSSSGTLGDFEYKISVWVDGEYLWSLLNDSWQLRLVVPLVLFSSRSISSSTSTTLTSASSVVGDKRCWLAIAVTAANCSL